MGTAGFTNPSSPMAYPGLGFPHRAKRYRAEGSALSSSVCRSCRGMEEVVVRTSDLILPGRRRLYEFLPIRDQPEGLRFPRRAGRPRPRVSPFSSPVCLIFRCMERSDSLIGPYPGRVAMALRTPGWGFRTVRGGIDLRNDCFRPRFVRVPDFLKDC